MPDDFGYARVLEAAAQGLSVHETLAALEDQGMGLSEGSSACCDVAASLEAHGIEDDDLDPSWIRLRTWIKRSGGRG